MHDPPHRAVNPPRGKGWGGACVAPEGGGGQLVLLSQDPCLLCHDMMGQLWHRLCHSRRCTKHEEMECPGIYQEGGHAFQVAATYLRRLTVMNSRALGQQEPSLFAMPGTAGQPLRLRILRTAACMAGVICRLQQPECSSALRKRFQYSRRALRQRPPVEKQSRSRSTHPPHAAQGLASWAEGNALSPAASRAAYP